MNPYSLSVLNQSALGFFLSNNIKENVYLVFWEIILRKIKLMMEHTKLVTFCKVDSDPNWH